MVFIGTHSTRVEFPCQHLYFHEINKRSKLPTMNMGKRIEAELLKQGLERSMLYDLVPGLEDGTLSAIIKRDSRSSKFAPDIAKALGVELHWLLTGEGNKYLGAGAQPVSNVTQLPPPDPVLADLAALEPEDADVWRAEIRRAAIKARKEKQERDQERAARSTDPPLERRHTA